MSNRLIGLRQNLDGTYDFGGNWADCRRLGLKQGIPYHGWFAVDKGYHYRTKSPRAVATTALVQRDAAEKASQAYIKDNALPPASVAIHRTTGADYAKTHRQTSARRRALVNRFNQTAILSPIAWQAFKKAGGNSLFASERHTGKPYGFQYMGTPVEQTPSGPPHTLLVEMRDAIEGAVAQGHALAPHAASWRDGGYDPVGPPESPWGVALVSKGDGRCPVPSNERIRLLVGTPLGEKTYAIWRAGVVNWDAPREFRRFSKDFSDETYRLGAVETYEGQYPQLNMNERVRPADATGKDIQPAAWWGWGYSNRPFQRELALAESK